jgi:diguanylate cyclase (GGDEF)-like protein/PAS domain S-box-containing protein
MFDWNIETNEVEVNLNLEKMIDVYKKENVEYLKEWRFKIHKEDYRKVREETQKCVAGKIDFFDFEYRIKLKDDRYKWIKNTGKVVESINGKSSRLIGICQDVNERKILEYKLKKKNSLFQQAFNESNEAIALLDNNTCIIQVNKSFEKLFKYNNENIIGMNIDDLIIPNYLDNEGKVYSNKVINGEDIKIECIRCNKNSENINVSLHAFQLKLENGAIGICAIYNNISKRVIEEDKIKYLSTHDQLTGIYNRNYYQVELERLNKSRKLPISVIIADIDKLKYVNDNYGHTEGDNYIKTIVDIIKDVLRGEDIFARIGGDEFAIVLIETSKKESEMIIDRINEKIKQMSAKFQYEIGISMGVATEEEEIESLELLVIKADNRMYKSKNSKKN